MTKPINLDDDLEFAAVDVQFVDIILFGEPFRVLTGLNSYSLSRLVSGDPGALSQFIDELIHADDQTRFRKAMTSTGVLKDPENLNKLFAKLIEVATEGVPTKRPSASSRTASRRTSTPRSALASTKPKAAGSTTRR